MLHNMPTKGHIMKTTETKRQSAISVSMADNLTSITFKSSAGDEHTIAISDLSPAILDYAIMHGIKQKCVDAAAISRNPDTGKSATVADKWAALMAVATRIVGPDGQWNATRGEGDGTSGAGLLFRALIRMYPAKSPEQLREFLAGKGKSAQAALRKNPRVAAIIEEIRAERADDGDEVDTNAMLDELGEEE